MKKTFEDKLESVKARLKEQYDNQSNKYLEKQETSKAIFDQEIVEKNRELENAKAKNKQFIDELKRRSEKIKYDYSMSYEKQMAKTKEISDNLSNIQSENELKRDEWTQDIKKRRNEINNEIEVLKSSYANLLEDKKKTYEEMINELSSNKENVQAEIANLKETYQAKQDEYNAYKQEKDLEFEKLESQTSFYLNDIRNKLKDIASKRDELNKVHEQRMSELKNQLADAFGAFDELTKVRPLTLKKESEEENEKMLEVANAFKSDLNALEKKHKETLEELNDEKNRTLEKINESFSNLVKDKENSKLDYDKEIDDIATFYGALIIDERKRQESLKQEIEKDNFNIKKIYDDYLNDTKKVEDSLLSEKELLEKENLLNASSLDAEYGSDIKNLTGDIKNLENDKDDLTKKVGALRQAYISVDNMMELKRVALLDIFKNKLNEINAYYNNVADKIKDIGGDSDVFREDISNIFKKNSD